MWGIQNIKYKILWGKADPTNSKELRSARNPNGGLALLFISHLEIDIIIKRIDNT